MSRALERLPLFPLNTVLFPYAQILVHVFEDRYRTMIEECLRDEQPFGVVLIREGSEVGPDPADPYLVGTAVRIMGREVFEDGNMNVRVQGERRFRIREIREDLPYLTGLVEPVVELELDDTPRIDALVMRAREEFEAWVQMQIAHRGLSVQIRFPDDITALSFAIANFLPITNLEKQHLLEITDTADRFVSLIPIIEQQIAEMRIHPGLTKLSAGDLSDWVSRN